MNLTRLLTVLVLSTTAAAAADRLTGDREPETSESPRFVFSLLPKAFDPHPHVDYNVITEMTPAGRKLPKATPQKPVFYAIHPGGELRLGEGATFNDKGPPVEEMQRILQSALSESHLLEASEYHASPTVLIVFHWGSFTVPTEIDSEEDDAGDTSTEGEEGAETEATDTGASTSSTRAGTSQVTELIERARLVGGDRFAEDLVRALSDRGVQNDLRQRQHPAPGMVAIPNIMGDLGNMFVDPLNPIERFKRADKDNEGLLTDAFGSIYFVLASAYDYDSVARNERVLLWRTKMTINADGVSMSETLLPLITNAGPYFGRDMRSATVVSRRLDREGSVEIGTPTVIEVIDDAPPAPAPAEEPVQP